MQAELKQMMNPNFPYSASKDRAAEISTGSQTMNRYQTSNPRAVLSIAAVAMTAITIGISVIVPAKMDYSSHDLGNLTASKAAAPASADVGPLRVEVVGVRTPEPVSVQARNIQIKRKQ